MVDYVKLCDIVPPVVMPEINKTTEEYKTFLRSVQVTGVIQPVTVSPIEGGKYRLVTGLYRYVASVDAKKETIPAHVHKMTEQEIAEMELLHCTHRIETKPADYAKAIKRFLQHYTIEELAVKIGKTVDWVKGKLRHENSMES